MHNHISSLQQYWLGFALFHFFSRKVVRLFQVKVIFKGSSFDICTKEKDKRMLKHEYMQESSFIWTLYKVKYCWKISAKGDKSNPINLEILGFT